MESLKGGFDFDGVIVDTPRKKLEIAYNEFGIKVPIEECTKQGFLNKGMTEAQYLKLQDIVYSDYDLKPVKGCVTYLKSILRDCHMIMVRSYRKRDPGNQIVAGFLIDNKIAIEDAICTDNNPKSKYCSNLDFFVDDRVEHLVDLKKTAKNLFLLDAPYNKNDTLSDGILRVQGWKGLYTLIRKISNR